MGASPQDRVARAPALAVSRQRLLEGADRTQQVEGEGVR